MPADDVLTHLGLDSSDFTKSAEQVKKEMKGMQKEADYLSATIKFLDANMRKVGGGTERQSEKMRGFQERLKKVRSEMDMLARSSEKVSEKQEKQVKEEKKEKREADEPAFRAVSFFAALTFIGHAIHRLGVAMFELGENVERARDRFQAGGTRVGAQGNAEMSAMSTGLRPIIEDQAAAFKNKIADIGVKSTIGLGGIVAKLQSKLPKALGGDPDAFDNYIKGVESIKADGDKEEAAKAGIRADQDAAASMAKDQTHELYSQLQILQKQYDIEHRKLNLANLDTVQGRLEANQAKEAMGAIRLQMENAQRAHDLAANSARADTEAMRLKQEGMKNVAEYVKTEADYNLKILEARRAGNSELAEQLEMQQQMKLKEIGVNEHNLTSRDLLDERRAARKFERDARHQAARERDMQDRAKRGAWGQTKGSRFDRFQRQQAGRDAAAPVWKMVSVHQMSVANLTVTIP